MATYKVLPVKHVTRIVSTVEKAANHKVRFIEAINCHMAGGQQTVFK